MRFFSFVIIATATFILPLDAEGLLAKLTNKRVFGEKLSKHVDKTTKVPFLVTKCIEVVTAAFGKHEPMEGVYKESAPLVEVDALVKDIEKLKAKVDTSTWTAMQASTVLRRYLKELPEPLISAALSATIRDAVAKNDQTVVKSELAKLDEVQRTTLGVIANHAHQFAIISDETRVGLAELAATFTPLFFNFQAVTADAIQQVSKTMSTNLGGKLSASATLTVKVGAPEWRKATLYVIEQAHTLFPAYKLDTYLLNGLSAAKRLPFVLTKCVEAIDAIPSDKWQDGLYRIPVGAAAISNLMQELSDKKEAIQLDPTVPDGDRLYTIALKKYLGSLTPQLINGAVQAAFDKAAKSNSIPAAVAAIKSGGPTLTRTVQYLLQHLKKLIAAKQTLMTPVALGIIFGTTLFAIPPGMTELTIVPDRKLWGEFLLTNLDAFITIN